jgi:hypothetical protein
MQGLRANRVAVAIVVVFAGLIIAGLALRARDHGGLANVNVSQARWAQSEVSAAIDQRNPKVMLAGSNSWQEAGVRSYSSNDGGVSWESVVAPPMPPGVNLTYPAGDPSVAIDGSGRQYFLFLVEARMWVATRANANATWVTRKPALDAGVSRPGAYTSSDKGVIAVDVSPASPRSGRVYAAWSEMYEWTSPKRRRASAILMTHSDDGGRSWTVPRPVVSSAPGCNTAPPHCWPFAVSIAVAPNGVVYVAWTDDRDVFAARLRGGAVVGPMQRVTARACGSRGGWRIPAVHVRYFGPLPTILVDRSRQRINVVFPRIGCNGTHDVWLGTFAMGMRERTALRRVNPKDQGVSDQFQPAATIDGVTGDLWVCYYDTSGDPRRIVARFQCTASVDGGASFAKPRAVATAPTNERASAASLIKSGGEYGDYQSVVAWNGTAHAFWTDTRDLITLNEEIRTARLKAP